VGAALVFSARGAEEEESALIPGTRQLTLITKGGLNAVTLSLASEHAKQGIGFNAVAPGVVDSPMHQNDGKSLLKSLNPMGALPEATDVAQAVIYLTEARYVTGEVQHVDAGAHGAKW